MHDNNSHRLLFAACAISLITGCATTTDRVALDASNTKIQPVFRVQQPAGTAAGQYAVGRIELADGRIGAAIVRFRNALKLDPAFVDAQNGLGVAYGQQGRFDKAAEAFRAALALAPASPYVLNNLGYAEMKAGRLVEARESFRHSLAIDPKNVHTRENVRLLVQLEQDSRAVVMEVAPAPVRAAAPAQAAPPQASVATVLSRTDKTMLVQLAPNVYELRPASPIADAHERSPVVSPVAVQPVVAPVAVAAPAVAAAAVATPAVAAAAITEAAVTEAPRAASPTPAVVRTVAPRATPSAPAVVRTAAPRAPVAAVTRFEVSNGVGIERLAARTAVRFARLGIGISRVSNYESFDRVQTEIHYRKGFLEQARLVQAKLPVAAKLVASGSLRTDINVRLVVGRDMATGSLAWWDRSLDMARGEASDGERHL